MSDVEQAVVLAWIPPWVYPESQSPCRKSLWEGVSGSSTKTVGRLGQGYHQVPSLHGQLGGLTQGVFGRAYQVGLRTHLWDKRLTYPSNLGCPRERCLSVLVVLYPGNLRCQKSPKP